MGVFAENWLVLGFLSPQNQADGSWVFNDPQLPGPQEFNPIPWVVASRDTGKFLKALVIEQEPGTRFYGVSEFEDRAEIAEIWENIHRDPTTTRPVSKDDFAAAWPELIRDEMIDNFSFVKEFEYVGNDPDVKRPWDLGIKTTTIEEYIKTEDWSSLTYYG